MGVYGHVLFEKKLTAKDRKKIDDKYYGLPEERKYPLNDEAHVRAAITYFNKCDPEKQPELARNIIRRMKQLGMEVDVSPENNFSKYYHPKKKKEE